MNAQTVRKPNEVCRDPFRLKVGRKVAVGLSLANGSRRRLSPSHEIAFKLLPQIGYCHAFRVEEEENPAQRKPPLIQGNTSFKDLLKGSDALERIYDTCIMLTEDFSRPAEAAEQEILAIFEIVTDYAGGPARTICNLPDRGRGYPGLRDDVQ